MPDVDLDMLVGLLSSLRGKLALPSGIDGRFEMPLLRVTDAQADVDAADNDAAVGAFAAGHSRVQVGELGVVERVELPDGELAGQVAIVTGGAGALA